MDKFYAEQLWQKAKEQWMIDENDPSYAKILTAFCFGVNHVPEGYVLVPVEPTFNMVQAGEMYAPFYHNKGKQLINTYKAMIQAAQEKV